VPTPCIYIPNRVVEPTQRRLTHDPFNKTFEVVFSRSQQALIAKAWAATGNGGTEGGGRATSAGGGECATAPPSPAQPVPPAYDCNVLHLHLGTDQWATRPTTSPVTGGQQPTPSLVTGGRPCQKARPLTPTPPPSPTWVHNFIFIIFGFWTHHARSAE
jgi:hypothetical protein